VCSHTTLAAVPSHFTWSKY